jgi:hypothetical protein
MPLGDDLQSIILQNVRELHHCGAIGFRLNLVRLNTQFGVVIWITFRLIKLANDKVYPPLNRFLLL